MISVNVEVKVQLDPQKICGALHQATATIAEDIRLDIQTRAVYTIYDWAAPNPNTKRVLTMSKEEAIREGRMPVWEGTLRDSLVVQEVEPMHFHVAATAPHAAKLEFGGTAADDALGYLKWLYDKQGITLGGVYDFPKNVQPHHYMGQAAKMWNELQDRQLRIKTVIEDSLKQ